jgi:RNA methyltransferase, TrmH family
MIPANAGRNSGRPDDAAVTGITSRQNPLVKLARSLDDRKARRETGLFLAEGDDVLAAALAHGWPPRLLFHGAGAAPALLARAEQAGAALHVCSAPVMAALSAMENPPAVIGVFPTRYAPLTDPASARGVWLMLDRLRTPGNLGSIIRTAHAVGAHGIVLVEPSCDPFAPEAVRASMGSVFAVPVATVEPQTALALTGAWPGDTIALAMTGDGDFRQPVAQPALIIAGSESDGVSPTLATAARRRVALPMPGGTESLNVAAATAVMLYAAAFPSTASA